MILDLGGLARSMSRLNRSLSLVVHDNRPEEQKTNTKCIPRKRLSCEMAMKEIPTRTILKVVVLNALGSTVVHTRRNLTPSLTKP